MDNLINWIYVVLKRGWYILLLFVSVIALLDSIYLIWHHYLLVIVKPSLPSFCSINSFIDCDSVAKSDYSMFFGIPAASMGVFAYLFLIFQFLIPKILFRRDVKKHYYFAFCIMTVMGLFSLRQFLASVFVLRSLCLMCSILYLCIIFMLVSLRLILIKDSVINVYKKGLNFLLEMILLKEKKTTIAFYLIILFFSFSMAYLTQEGINNYLQKNNVRKDVVEEIINPTKKYYALKENIIDYSGLPFKGVSDAPFVFLEISDFQCSFCKKKGDFLLKLLKEYPEIIRIYFLHYPLDQDCNSNIKRAFHDKACKISRYSICAKEQELFWPFHDFIFSNQNMISDELLDEAVTKLELDKIKFKSCLNTVASTRLNLEINRAKKLGTSYTPTIFLNGRKISDTFRTNKSVKNLLETIIGDTIKQQN